MDDPQLELSLISRSVAYSQPNEEPNYWLDKADFHAIAPIGGIDEQA
ncbi:MAG: hypothetical protein KA138_10470 [Saprospiraceae bacterium]|nr:hypothetical protein [Saprospiraceae bacterium]